MRAALSTNLSPVIPGRHRWVARPESIFRAGRYGFGAGTFGAPGMTPRAIRISKKALLAGSLLASSHITVVAGLVPATPNFRAQSKNKRGGRDKPGHDLKRGAERVSFQRNQLGRHGYWMCAFVGMMPGKAGTTSKTSAGIEREFGQASHRFHFAETRFNLNNSLTYNKICPYNCHCRHTLIR
jgi:hypothetical protein